MTPADVPASTLLSDTAPPVKVAVAPGAVASPALSPRADDAEDEHRRARGEGRRARAKRARLAWRAAVGVVALAATCTAAGYGPTRLGITPAVDYLLVVNALVTLAYGGAVLSELGLEWYTNEYGDIAGVSYGLAVNGPHVSVWGGHVAFVFTFSAACACGAVATNAHTALACSWDGCLRALAASVLSAATAIIIIVTVVLGRRGLASRSLADVQLRMRAVHAQRHAAEEGSPTAATFRESPYPSPMRTWGDRDDDDGAEEGAAPEGGVGTKEDIKGGEEASVDDCNKGRGGFPFFRKRQHPEDRSQDDGVEAAAKVPRTSAQDDVAGEDAKEEPPHEELSVRMVFQKQLEELHARVESESDVSARGVALLFSFLALVVAAADTRFTEFGALIYLVAACLAGCAWSIGCLVFGMLHCLATRRTRNAHANEAAHVVVRKATVDAEAPAPPSSHARASADAVAQQQSDPYSRLGLTGARIRLAGDAALFVLLFSAFAAAAGIATLPCAALSDVLAKGCTIPRGATGLAFFATLAQAAAAGVTRRQARLLKNRMRLAAGGGGR